MNKLYELYTKYNKLNLDVNLLRNKGYQLLQRIENRIYMMHSEQDQNAAYNEFLYIKIFGNQQHKLILQNIEPLIINTTYSNGFELIYEILSNGSLYVSAKIKDIEVKENTLIFKEKFTHSFEIKVYEENEFPELDNEESIDQFIYDTLEVVYQNMIFYKTYKPVNDISTDELLRKYLQTNI